jgi:hypothetical protein
MPHNKRSLKPSVLRRLPVAAAMLLQLCLLTSGQSPDQTATVHLSFVDFRGRDLGIAIVTLFNDESSRKFAYRFGDNTARNIPFGTYHLTADKLYYAHVDRTIPVYQKDVLAVIQLNIDEEGGPLRYRLQGEVSGWPSEKGRLWIRAQGLYSGVIADTQTESDGKFEIAGLPYGTYIVSTRQDARVLDIRSVLIPSEGKEQTGGVIVPILIELNSTRE